MKNLVLAVALALAPAAAWAEIGKVTALEGGASRTGADGKSAALEVGSAIELKDKLEVKAGGMLKLTLNDGSVIALDSGSRLEITLADFEGQERRGFGAFLGAGKIWTSVKKALGGAKYEISTQRAVAGVRGTVFRIDADALLAAASKGGKSAKGRRADVVRVLDGVVRVNPSAEVAKKSKAAAPPKAPKGPRTQVAGPQEISADAWEARFVELQQNTQIAVGVDIWEQAELAQKDIDDKFQKWATGSTP